MLTNAAPNSALPTARELVSLTVPQLGMMLCHLAVSMTDLWVAGRLDASVQASLGIVSQVFTLLMLITSLAGSGCLTTISQALGAGLEQRARRYAALIDRPVTIIIPFGPGGAVDIAARILAEYFQNKHQITLNIVCKAGGAGAPAMLDVAKARPDGYTFGFPAIATFSTTPQIDHVPTGTNKTNNIEVLNV